MSMTSNNFQSENEGFVSVMSLQDFRQCHKGSRFATSKWGDKVKHGVDFAKPNGGYTFVAFSEKCGAISADELKKGFLGEGNIMVGENQDGYHYFFRSKMVHEVGEVID